jgi:hypothetical protein
MSLMFLMNSAVVTSYIIISDYVQVCTEQTDKVEWIKSNLFFLEILWPDAQLSLNPPVNKVYDYFLIIRKPHCYFF